MAYKLPDGTLILRPRIGRDFVIGAVRHPEMNLRSESFRTAYGIEIVDDPVRPGPTPEQLAARALEARQTARIQQLQQATIDQMDMILALFRAGREKGVWTVADFPATLVQKAQEWQQIISDFRAEE